MLDPAVWIENSIVPSQEPFVANNDQPPNGIDQAAIEKATAEWRQSRLHPGRGNEMFFAYALALRTAGMNLSYIERKLFEESQFGRTPRERKDQISSIIATLKQTARKSPAWA